MKLQGEVASLQERVEREKLAKSEESSELPSTWYNVDELLTCTKDTKRKLQNELQDLKVSSAAASVKHSELAEAVKAYRAKAENYLTRLERTEIERAKAANGEAFGRPFLHL